MIINIDRNPALSLYYLGGVILQELGNDSPLEIDNLYKECQAQLKQDLHIDFFYYALDWLFLLSLVNLENGKVLLCALKN